LFASQNPQDFGELKSPAPQLRGGAEQPLSKNENPTFFENRKFVSYLIAPAAGLEPATNWLHVISMFPSGMDYIIALWFDYASPLRHLGI